jgi:hypothetical protein
MIIVAATTDAGKSSQWIISLEEFSSFYANTEFQTNAARDRIFILNTRIWYLDNTYAQSFLYNFNNYGIEVVQDYLKEATLGEIFPDTNIHRDQVFMKQKSE